MKLLFSHTADDPASRAVTAIGGTSVSHQKQNSIRIAVHQSWYRHIAIFAAGVSHFERIRNGFLDPGDYLPSDGAIRVGAIDQIEEVRSNRESKVGTGAKNISPVFDG